MNINETQRWPEVDIIELIANLIASYSHLFELYNSNVVELDSIIAKWEWDEEWIWDLQKWLEELLWDVYVMRKRAMAFLKNLSPDYNQQAHCLLKHAIASYQYAIEIRDTDRGNEEYQLMVLDTTQYMYKIVSFYMWTELTTCGRCLYDELWNSRDLPSTKQKEWVNKKKQPIEKQ